MKKMGKRGHRMFGDFVKHKLTIPQKKLIAIPI